MASMAERVADLQEKGFKLVDKSQLVQSATQPAGFPDVVMVADGSVAHADITQGVAFLHNNDARNDTVHFALPGNVSDAQLDKVGRCGGMMLETNEGRLSGYIFPYSPFNSGGLDALCDTLKSEGLKTQKIPMDPVAYGLFPYFNHPERNPLSLNMNETVDILSHHLKGKVDVMDMTYEQRNRAFGITDKTPDNPGRSAPGLSRKL